MEPNNFNQNPVPNQQPQTPPPVQPEPTSVPPTQTTPTPSQAVGGLTLSKIALIVAIIAVGAGAFIFLNGGSSGQAGENNPITMNTETNKPLSCKGLLPDADLERITGKSALEFSIAQNGLDLNSTGDAAVSDIKDQYGSFESGSKTFSCAYSIEEYAPHDTKKQYPTKSLVLNFMLLSSDKGDMSPNFQVLKDSRLYRENAIPQGIGSDAFDESSSVNGKVTALSADKQYVLSVTLHNDILGAYSAEAEPQLSSMAQEIARTISNNLSK